MTASPKSWELYGLIMCKLLRGRRSFCTLPWSTLCSQHCVSNEQQGRRSYTSQWLQMGQMKLYISVAADEAGQPWWQNGLVVQCHLCCPVSRSRLDRAADLQGGEGTRVSSSKHGSIWSASHFPVAPLGRAANHSWRCCWLLSCCTSRKGDPTMYQKICL